MVRLLVTGSDSVMFCDREHLVWPVDMAEGTNTVYCPRTATESRSAMVSLHINNIVILLGCGINGEIHPREIKTIPQNDLPELESDAIDDRNIKLKINYGEYMGTMQ